MDSYNKELTSFQGVMGSNCNTGLSPIVRSQQGSNGGNAGTIAGKTGTGTIGMATVTITFTGKDGKGKFTVGGDLAGEGEWKQDGAGVVFETRLSRFVGDIEGDKLKGQRFTKKPGEDGENAMLEWSVTLADTPKDTEKKVDIEADITKGVWVMYSSNDYVMVYRFNADKTADFFIAKYPGVPDEKKVELVMKKKPANRKTSWSALDKGRVAVKEVFYWNDTNDVTDRESYELVLV